MLSQSGTGAPFSVISQPAMKRSNCGSAISHTTARRVKGLIEQSALDDDARSPRLEKRGPSRRRGLRRSSTPLNLQVVDDTPDAVHLPRYFGGALLHRRAIHGAIQLHDALTRVDINLRQGPRLLLGQL